MPPAPDADPDPRPDEVPFLFVMLCAARKAGDAMLEALARRWLAEKGVYVTFAAPASRPRKAVPRG